MDTDSAKLLRQIKQYYKDTATYQKAKQALHLKQSRGLGGSDKQVQKMLKTMGLDVPALVQETDTVSKALAGVHKAYFGLVHPPIVPGGGLIEVPPDPNVVNVKPPAIDGFGTNCSAVDRGLNLALAEMNFELHSQGDGWGWSATAGSPCLTTLIFMLNPPRAGNVSVDAYVDCQGQFAISANDHWYTSTSADLTLSVCSKLYQHYWEFGPTVTLIDEHRTDSSNSGWVSQMVKLSYSTSLSANDTVLILVDVEFDANAHSDDARVDLDFKTGAERYIRVPLIQFRYL